MYNAGAADPRPRLPSLTLLPANCLAEQERESAGLRRESTGLLRRGEDEFVVADRKLEAAAFLLQAPSRVGTGLGEGSGREREQQTKMQGV